MLGVPFEPVDDFGRELSVVGQPIVLYGDYDPDQEWFGFMQGTILSQERTETRHLTPVKLEEKKKSDAIKLKTRSAYGYTVVKNSLRTLHQFDKHVPQYVIPFEEHFRLNGDQYANLATVQHLGWERTASGAIYKIEFEASKAGKVEQWCKAQCSGFYYVHKKHCFAAFQNGTDAVAAAIWFQRSTPKGN